MKSKCVLILIFILFYLFLTPVQADENTLISMDFKDADLRDVFRTLAQIAEVNLIVHQSVQGKITLTLNEVSFEEAIKLITIINDLEYHWVGNTLLIAEPTEIEENFTEMGIRAFNIQYAEMDKIKEVLERLLIGSTIVIDDRTRTLVFAGKKSQLTEAQKIISKLDVPIPQVFLDVRVEEISTTGLDKVGVPQGDYAKLKLILNSNGFVTDIGFDFPNIVESLRKEGLARTLANPGLVTLDGEASRLLIGDKVPVEAEEEVDGQLKTVVKYIEAGIKLEFTPRISDDGYITLQVKPQVSSLGEYLTRGYPLIRSREFETVVRIRDGETFVIGGLIREEDRKSLEKVPFLGDIPILGMLFRHNENSRQSTEIVIFITPRIIYPQTEIGNSIKEQIDRKKARNFIEKEMREDEQQNHHSLKITP
ncbi:hypothetical protein BBF96_09270 [Anoxybacter fermentans]|uniref:Uncharacterized protein n=1 Tax=Anoxybacter fermentans TaxID=1323375 RepID=A0A3S9SZ30_9FIRM|nr:secretin N-terminal domain-containing protein [Anoxybacter fermentans]AZR73561.1 hypothetical protein BBF96_09270 [Anoxybacter fermentans]